MNNWSISLANLQTSHFSSQKHALVTINEFLEHSSVVIENAFLQKFAEITPQYPGVRSPLPQEVCEAWLEQLSPVIEKAFPPTQPASPNAGKARWAMQGWYSIVTTPPEQLQPIQRLPHVDGTDPDQIALMLYLHTTQHGGTAFFRHKSTGLEALTQDSYPRYAAALQQDVKRSGLPSAAYTTSGEPHFERTHAAPGTFNQAVLYRGNILHSGVISNSDPLPADPKTGRLTINAFLRREAPQG